jgi:hypothetical protein
MSKIFHFTDGVTLNSHSGIGPFTNTPYDTAKVGSVARARTTTRQLIFDELDFALTQAGWTRFQTIAGQDHVYTSNGESGTENINIRLRWITANRYLYFGMSTKLTGGNILDAGGEIGGTNSTGTTERWDLTASDFTADFQILATKDHIQAWFQNINHTSTMYSMFLGNFVRIGDNNNVLTLQNSVVAGDNVVLTPTTDPFVAGYRPRDTIAIVEVDPPGAAAAERQFVLDVTSTTITLRKLANAYTGSAAGVGARIGHSPTPTMRSVGNNSLILTPLLSVRDVLSDDILVASVSPVGTGFTSPTRRIALNDTHLNSAFGSGTLPNNRTNRFTSRSFTYVDGSAGTYGMWPCLLVYPGSIIYHQGVGLGGNDYAEHNRATPLEYFAPVRFTSTTASHFMLGPVPQ